MIILALWVWVCTGHIYFDQEKYEEARDYYEKHFELFPGMCFCVVCLVIK